MTNLDEFKAEYDAEKAAQKAAEKAKKEAEWEALVQERRVKEEALRKKIIDRNCKFMTRIEHAVVNITAVSGSAWEVSHDKEKGTLSIANVDVTNKIHISEDERIIQRSWRGNVTEGKGTYSIRIGDRWAKGGQVRFKQNKSGQHDYNEIAKMLLGSVKLTLDTIRITKQRELNKNPAAELKLELKLIDYGPLNLAPSSSETKPYFVTVKVERAMTKDEVVKLIAVLEECGMKVTKD